MLLMLFHYQYLEMLRPKHCDCVVAIFNSFLV